MLLEWAATSVFLILAVLLLRAALGRRISASLRYALWGLVLLRLLVPVQLFTSPVVGTQVLAGPPSGQSQAAGPALPAATAGPAPQAPEISGEPGTVPAFPAAPQAPAVPAAPDLAAVLPWLGWAWLAGGVAAGAVLLASNLRFAVSLRRRRVPLEGADCPLPVYVAEGLPSPCLFGLFRPAVYVSPETAADPAALRHVLAHEHTHFRHLDHIWNLLRCAALAVHWWDPLVWLAAGLSRRDGELACDEGALKRLGDGERSGYGKTLLSLVTVKPGPGELFRCATTMAGDKRSLTERVKCIAHASRPAVWAAVLVVLAALLAGACAFSRAQEDPPPPDALAAELRFSGGAGEVVISGTVDGADVPEGTVWRASDGVLTMRCPDFTDRLEGSFQARWADDSRRAVTVSTRLMAMLSSYAPSGYWEFTVDLSGAGSVSRMEARIAMDGPEAWETRMYPEAISEAQAIQTARAAACLLAAAEEHYGESARTETALKAVLWEGAPFALASGGERAELTAADIPALFDPDDPYMEIQRYAAVDLDRDGKPEYVLQVCGAAGDTGGWLILHADRETVCGCKLDSRAIEDLKADGTFSYSLPGGTEAGTRAVAALTSGGCSVEDLSCARGNAWTWETFEVDGKAASEEAWLAARAAQAAKPDAAWYAYQRDSAAQPTPAPESGLEFSPGVGDGADEVFVSGLEGALVEWGREGGGSNSAHLRFSGSLAAFCPELAGREAEAGWAMWAGGDRDVLSVTMYVGGVPFDEGASTLYHFTVELTGGAFLRLDDPLRTGEDAPPDLTEGQLLAFARRAAGIMNAAEAYFLGALDPTPTPTPEPTPPPTPIPTEPITDPEQTMALVEGFYHRPFEELPQDLRDSLEWDGKRQPHEVYRCYLRTYVGPNIVIVTTEATEEMLRDWLDEQLSMPEGDERRIGTDEEIRAEYEQERGREWLYSVTITGDSYATLLGLKVGDTLEEAAALGYDLSKYLDDEGTGRSQFGPVYGNPLSVSVKNRTVEEMYLRWGMGRFCGKYWE